MEGNVAEAESPRVAIDNSRSMKAFFAFAAAAEAPLPVTAPVTATLLPLLPFVDFEEPDFSLSDGFLPMAMEIEIAR
jgi:hypothetical protein